MINVLKSPQFCGKPAAFSPLAQSNGFDKIATPAINRASINYGSFHTDL
jgi:hypothetical protein